jgi:hypothetical protein
MGGRDLRGGGLVFDLPGNPAVVPPTAAPTYWSDTRPKPGYNDDFFTGRAELR